MVAVDARVERTEPAKKLSMKRQDVVSVLRADFQTSMRCQRQTFQTVSFVRRVRQANGITRKDVQKNLNVSIAIQEGTRQ